MKRKVGDKVRVKSLDWYNSNKNKDGNVTLPWESFTEDMSEFCGQIVTIKEIRNNQYIIEEDDFGWNFSDEMFEEGIYLNEFYCDKNNISSIGITPLKTQKIIWTESAPDTTELVIGKNYELVMEDGVYKVIKKKPKYPKTYEECCEVMCGSVTNTYGDCIIKINDGYKDSLIQSFQRLIFYRDAYWKIAGEEMSLGKPWEPTMETVYCISRNNNVIKGSYRGGKCNILEFPTEEMRDAFYENFKDLIEQCKELV